MRACRPMCDATRLTVASCSSRTALVYCGKGAGTRSVLSAVEALRQSLSSLILVGQLDTEELLNSPWQKECVLLVMPGGADLPYCKALNGRGNKLIREYVEAGGSYLGLCAGAYYACARIEFELGTRLEVQGDRELQFFTGVGRGGVYPGFQYMSEEGAVAAELALHPQEPGGDWQHKLAGSHPEPCFYDYSNGGCRFDLDSTEEDGEARIRVLASYCDVDMAAAAVLCRVAEGRAVLCGTHPELAPHWLGKSDLGICMEQSDSGKIAAAVKAKLEETQELRVHFWEQLLRACSLAAYLA